MIIHNLHIHYKSDDEGDHKDIYLALDSDDIQSLKILLERAENKEKFLKEGLTKAGLTDLNE